MEESSSSLAIAFFLRGGIPRLGDSGARRAKCSLLAYIELLPRRVPQHYIEPTTPPRLLIRLPAAKEHLRERQVQVEERVLPGQLPHLLRVAAGAAPASFRHPLQRSPG